MSTRQKKIRTRLFLQEKLAEHPHFKKHFPLYLYINFLGQNTKLSITEQGRPIYWNEEMLKEYDSGERSGFNSDQFRHIDNLIEVIENVLRYEHSIDQDRYSLKGLRERLDLHERDITTLVENRARELFYLDFKCTYPDLGMDESYSLEMMVASSQMLVDIFTPSALVRSYIELHVAIYLFSHGFIREEEVPLSVYQKMIISWFKDDQLIQEFHDSIGSLSETKADIRAKLSSVRGFPKMRLDLIDQYSPTQSRFSVYHLLMAKLGG